MTLSTSYIKELCLEFFRAGVSAADPRTATRNCLSYDNQQLSIRGNSGQIRCGRWNKIHIIAIGKAAAAMAAAARDAIPTDILAEPGLVVTGYDSAGSLTGFNVRGAGHPLPDQNGVAAAHAVAEKLQNAQAGELVLLLISGGASAMLPYPVDPISLDDKIATTGLLLGSGATINEVNCVRKHLSKLKGGGMARLAVPADLQALILSDVPGDDFSTIASGPSVADPSTFANAISILENRQLLDRAPASVRQYLLGGSRGLQPETLKPGDPVLKSVSCSLIGSNALSIAAVCQTVSQQGYQTLVYSRTLAGEAREVAKQWAETCAASLGDSLKQAMAFVAGGETTVTLSGSGKGGRNQEMALAFALAAERLDLKCRWTFLSAGTDGRDGPTDAAGGIVDQTTLEKIRRSGIDPQAALDDNDSYPTLKSASALVMTGATGTNVADIQILLLNPLTEYSLQERLCSPHP
jgi:glycerate 2-kinase